MTQVVKKLQAKNWQEFYLLFQAVVSEKFSYYPQEAIDRFLDPKRIRRNWKKNKEIFVALRGREIVAFLIAIDAGGGVSFCNWVGVRKGLRRQGVGKSLIETWESWAKSRGCHKLRAQTSKRENQAFFEKLGFKLEGKKENDRYHLDCWLFGKII